MKTGHGSFCFLSWHISVMVSLILIQSVELYELILWMLNTCICTDLVFEIV